MEREGVRQIVVYATKAKISAGREIPVKSG